MTPDPLKQLPDDDPSAASRKQDHIKLAFESRIEAHALDPRFYYEPLLARHPEPGSLVPFNFLGKKIRTPMWVSSMTGGTKMAAIINKNLARACAEFGMGMGLGSCRQLLNSDDYLPDFDVRGIIGDDLPLYANLGIAQLELLIAQKQTDKIKSMLGKLRADGLIIHVNPLQEAMQPEGDIFKFSPIQTIETLLELLDCPLVVKEVGQGMGPKSLRALLQLPLAAVEFAAAGGTNFAKLELLRSDEALQTIYAPIAATGHTASDMLDFVRRIHAELGRQCKVDQLIISGGVQDFMDGYYLIQTSPLSAVFGQASAFLKFAQDDYDTLRNFVQLQVRGLELAYAYLQVRDDHTPARPHL
jgi:isopentenyl-diphosphate delta-isomerase